MPAHEPPFDVLLPVFAVAVVSMLAGLSVISRIVKIERERHPVAWEADGRPAAPWIVPWRLPPKGDPSLPRSPFALMRTNSLMMRWMVVTPTWARGDASARRLLWLLRGLQVVALACTVTWFALVLPHVGSR